MDVRALSIVFGRLDTRATTPSHSSTPARFRRVFLTLALALVSLAGAATPAGDPVKIGLLMSGMGHDPSFAEAALRGARLAIDDLNAAGGILGRPAEPVVEDNRFSPANPTRSPKNSSATTRSLPSSASAPSVKPCGRAASSPRPNPAASLAPPRL